MFCNGLCMKRSVQKDANFSVKHRAEFLYIVFIFSILKAKYKNLSVFANKQNLSIKHLLAMLYTPCWQTFLSTRMIHYIYLSIL